jgi:hypothetical protein
MDIDVNRIEDLELLLGITSLRTTLDKVIESIWVPFWRHLPRQLRTPRTLLNNKQIVFSLLEALGCRLVSEHVLLFQQYKELKSESNTIREEMLAHWAALVPFAQRCQVYNFTNPSNGIIDEVEFDDLQNIFSDDDIAGCSEPSVNERNSGPYWSLRITFSRDTRAHHLEKILSHQEYIMHFADKAEVVYTPFPPTNTFDELDFE